MIKNPSTSRPNYHHSKNSTDIGIHGAPGDSEGADIHPVSVQDSPWIGAPVRISLTSEMFNGLLLG